MGNLAHLTPEILADVTAACKAGTEKAAEVFGRTFDAKVDVAVGEPGTLDMNALPDDLSGPGLAVVLTVAGAGALILLPEGSGLVPGWCADPDVAGRQSLTTLAGVLGPALLPEPFMPEDSKAARVNHLAEAMRRAGVSDGAGMVPLELSSAGRRETARVIWPALTPEAIIGSAMATPVPDSQPIPTAPPEATTVRGVPPPDEAPARREAGLKELPEYTRSLLRIKVPVVVTLAEKRQPVGRIVELGPGSIIQFDKSCEEMLELGVGDRPLALGEAVKVGDKFGLRIMSIILPGERFRRVKLLPGP